MCLIAIAWRARADLPLAVAANRDEWRDRPAQAAHWWPDHPDLLAGRDLQAGGTWMGITRQGRFAAVTNFRDPSDKRATARSRGALVTEFLSGAESPKAFLDGLAARAGAYNGFNLIVGDGASLWYYGSRESEAREVEPGVHGLSNHLLDTPWPKVEKGKARLAAQLGRPFEAEAAFSLLDDTERASGSELPSTGVSLEIEERLSSIRIPAVGGYGTRCSTVLCFGTDGKIEFHERSYREDGSASGTLGYRLTVTPGKARGSSRGAGSRPPGTPLPVR